MKMMYDWVQSLWGPSGMPHQKGVKPVASKYSYPCRFCGKTGFIDADEKHYHELAEHYLKYLHDEAERQVMALEAEYERLELHFGEISNQLDRARQRLMDVEERIAHATLS